MTNQISVERRHFDRHRKTYKHACIRTDGRELPVLMRDLSECGAGIETVRRLAVGQILDYRWDDEDFRTGKVIWVNENRVGIENAAVSNSLRKQQMPYRSVRVHASAPVSVFAGGRRIEGELWNVAKRGLCILTAAKIQQGALTTIRVGKRQIENVTAKWCGADKIGFAFPNALSIAEMVSLVEGN